MRSSRPNNTPVSPPATPCLWRCSCTTIYSTSPCIREKTSCSKPCSVWTVGETMPALLRQSLADDTGGLLEQGLGEVARQAMDDPHAWDSGRHEEPWP